MAFPYSAHKTYVDGETLTASDLNATDVNHINNNIPESIDDYSASVTEQRTTSDPDLDGSGDAPVTLAEEIEGLRHQLARLSQLLVGGTYWYNLIGTSQVLVPAGTSPATPPYGFQGEAGKGFYSTGTAGFAAAIGSSKVLEANATQFLGPAGTAADPAYSFITDPNTGMYPGDADEIEFATAGIQRLEISATDITASLPIDIDLASGDPKLMFSIGGTAKFVTGVDDDDSDIWKISIGDTLGTSDVLKINSGGIPEFTGDNSSSHTALRLSNINTTADSLTLLDMISGSTVGARFRLRRENSNISHELRIQHLVDSTLVDSFILTRTGTTPITRISNVGIGGAQSLGSGDGVLAIQNASTVPTGSITNGVLVYAEDVSASSELKVRDEAGNITTLS